jgi:CheY-like chemotaxis protein
MLTGGRASGRVLLVEDDLLTREAVTLLLSGDGYMVAAAGNGREALERLRAYERPDLILLDLRMPVMDGYAFQRHLQEDPGLASIPVLLFSAAGDAGARASDLGAAGCLQKPVATEQLLEAVHRCCGPGKEGTKA